MDLWDDLLGGDPVEKWTEIILHANEGSSKKELRRLLRLLAAYELVLQENEVNFNVDAKLKEYTKTWDEAVLKKVKDHKCNIAIESMAKILRENDG